MSKLITEESQRNFRRSIANMNKDIWNELKTLAKKTIDIDKSNSKLKVNQQEIEELESVARVNANQIKIGIAILKERIKKLVGSKRRKKPRKVKKQVKFLDFIQTPVKMKTVYEKEAQHEKLKYRMSKYQRMDNFSNSPNSRRSRRADDIKHLTAFIRSIDELSDSKRVKSVETANQRSKLASSRRLESSSK